MDLYDVKSEGNGKLKFSQEHVHLFPPNKISEKIPNNK